MTHFLQWWWSLSTDQRVSICATAAQVFTVIVIACTAVLAFWQLRELRKQNASLQSQAQATRIAAKASQDQALTTLSQLSELTRPVVITLLRWQKGSSTDFVLTNAGPGIAQDITAYEVYLDSRPPKEYKLSQDFLTKDDEMPDTISVMLGSTLICRYKAAGKGGYFMTVQTTGYGGFQCKYIDPRIDTALAELYSSKLPKQSVSSSFS